MNPYQALDLLTNGHTFATTADYLQALLSAGWMSLGAFKTAMAALVIPAPGTLCPALATEPFTTCIYGYPGVGKSPALVALPDCYYVDLQLGTKYSTFPLTSRRIIVNDYLEFIEAAEHWRAHRTRFVVIDPITTLYEWSIQHATVEYCRKPVGKNFGQSGEETVLDLLGKDAQGRAFNAGYRFVRESFMKLAKLFWPGINNRTIFVGHVRDSIMADIGMGEKGGKTTAEFDAKDLDIDGKLRNIFLSEIDLGVYMYRTATGVLRLTTGSKRNNAFVKCRCPHLLNRQFDFATPTTTDDWRDIFPDSIADLCGPRAVNPQPTTT